MRPKKGKKKDDDAAVVIKPKGRDAAVSPTTASVSSESAATGTQSQPVITPTTLNSQDPGGAQTALPTTGNNGTTTQGSTEFSHGDSPAQTQNQITQQTPTTESSLEIDPSKISSLRNQNSNRLNNVAAVRASSSSATNCLSDGEFCNCCREVPGEEGKCKKACCGEENGNTKGCWSQLCGLGCEAFGKGCGAAKKACCGEECGGEQADKAGCCCKVGGCIYSRIPFSKEDMQRFCSNMWCGTNLQDSADYEWMKGKWQGICLLLVVIVVAWTFGISLECILSDQPSMYHLIAYFITIVLAWISICNWCDTFCHVEVQNPDGTVSDSPRDLRGCWCLKHCSSDWGQVSKATSSGCGAV